MRTVTKLLCCSALILPGVFACDGSSDPFGPRVDPEVHAPAVDRASVHVEGDGMVPYRASASFAPGSANLTACASAGPPMALPALLIGDGPHSHMGRATSEITIESCQVTSAGVLGSGHYTHTARNGDSFGGSWDALFTPPTYTFVANGKDFPILAESGTGRFEGISGHAWGTGTIDPVTGHGTFSVRGMISSVGSLR